MTIKELKDIIKTLDDNTPVFVACQGYTNTTDDPGENETRFYSDGKMLVLSDSCYCNEIDG